MYMGCRTIKLLMWEVENMKRRWLTKVICIILVIIMSFCPLEKIWAIENNQNARIAELTEIYLKSALNIYELVGIPDVSDKEIQICQRINPYVLHNEVLVVNEDIGYFFLKADGGIFACLTVFYGDGEVISASLSTKMVDLVKNAGVSDKEFALISAGDTWYIKTNEDIILGECVNNQETQLGCTDYELGDTSSIELSEIEVEQTIKLTQTFSIQPRSSRVLSVPYVPQGNYNICWAAAAVALGEFYRDPEVYNYDPYDLACEIKGEPTVGSISESRWILTNKYNITTTYVSRAMTQSEVINCINQSRPILGAFFPTSGIGHMVVICGFNDGGTGSDMTYYLRDSNHQYYQVAGADSDGTVLLDYRGDAIYYFEHAAYH